MSSGKSEQAFAERLCSWHRVTEVRLSMSRQEIFMLDSVWAVIVFA